MIWRCQAVETAFDEAFSARCEGKSPQKLQKMPYHLTWTLSIKKSTINRKCHPRQKRLTEWRAQPSRK
jgi:hypothetical protein